MPTLILASASRDRLLCFQRAHIPVEVIASNFDEESVGQSAPRDLVQELAFRKAQAVAGQVTAENASRAGPVVIVAADTMVEFDGKLIGKASSKAEAHHILATLAGHTHQIYTGVCIFGLHSGRHEEFVAQASVHFQPLSDAEIEAYLTETDEYQGRAGAYSLFDRASLFVDHIEGSPTNVIGLPMALLRTALLGFGVDLLRPSSVGTEHKLFKSGSLLDIQ